MTLPTLVPVGTNDTRAWGLTASERLRRIAGKQGFTVGSAPTGGPALLVDLGHVFDPVWLKFAAGRPDTAITLGGRPVLTHLTDASGAAVAAIAAGRVPAGVATLAVEAGIDLHNHELRKREAPFLLPLTRESVPAVERASYYGAYKGVTDILTKYLWPELAFHLTRLAARIGLTPNMVTIIGLLFCVAAFFAFWDGRYWLGMGLGFVFMVLDTVDGKLARCTVTSSKIGNILDHGADLVHPPFWWWAWAHGLAAYGRPLDDDLYWPVLAVIVGGYVVGRFIEGVFMRAWGMHIHVWRPVDSQFRLVTARRNPNMVILFVATLLARPDLGLIAVAAWTVLSILFHLVRLLQAAAASTAGRPITSWLN